MDSIEPLAPDACRSDHSASCWYWHLKIEALNGGRDALSPEELAFVGIFPPRPDDGWHAISDLPALASADANDVQGSETDAAILRAMQALGMPQERLAFLG
jgi:hypothetical protein